ncbi:MAG: hypothetical protein H6562_09650 [Lewinellaceae bacterium]|nr:hypothetical protein [Lewinella sp.]MCB9279167.1 hypothetical protein [Lewinellaceae bacterium]
MINKNAIWVGVLIALLTPFVSYAVLLMIYERLDAMGWSSSIGLGSLFQERTLILVGICFNIFWVNYFQKKRLFQSLRGVVIATILAAFGWLFYYWEIFF